jgi:hypothetical protein
MALTEGTRVIVAGVPPQGIRMPCAEDVKVGDLLGIDSDGKVFPVDSDDAEHGRLVAGTDGNTTKDCTCYLLAVIDGFTSGTEAAAIYPSGTAGSYTETADTDAGDSNEIVGYVMTETMILVLPGIRADSVVAT